MKATPYPLNRPRRKKRSYKGSGWVSYLIGAAIVGLMFPFGWLLQALSGQSNWLPVSLHSVLSADYNADLRALHMPPIQLGLIEEVLNDSATLTPGRFATLEGYLTTPVPMVTSRPGDPTSTLPTFPIPPATPTPRPGQAASPTPLQASLTPASSQIPSVTPTFPLWNSPTPTQPDPIGYATRTHSPTQWRTSTPIATPPPDQTDTVRPPTSTQPAPTATPVPRPTRTPNPYPGPTSPPYP